MNNRTARTKRLVRAGFTLCREKNHQIWKCPCGHAKITVGCSHNEGRSAQNDDALINRTLRACKPTEAAA